MRHREPGERALGSSPAEFGELARDRPFAGALFRVLGVSGVGRLSPIHRRVFWLLMALVLVGVCLRNRRDGRVLRIERHGVSIAPKAFAKKASASLQIREHE
jgi:hypothetical protein